MAGLLAFAPGLASADRVSTTGVSALAPRDLFDAAPALAGDRVLYGVANGNAIGFWTAPLGGGPATHLPELTADGPIDGWALAADDERLAVDAYVTNEQGNKGHAVLFSGSIGAVPGVLADPIANLTSVQRQSLFVSGSQVLTLETRAGRLVARDA